MHKAPSNSLTVHLKYILFFLSSALGVSRCPSSSFSHQQDGGHDPWLPSTSHQRAQGVSIWFLQPSFCSKVLKTCKYLWYYFCHCWKLDATKDLLFDAGLEEVNRITFLHRPVWWDFWGTLKIIIWFDHSWLTLVKNLWDLSDSSVCFMWRPKCLRASCLSDFYGSGQSVVYMLNKTEYMKLSFLQFFPAA